MNNRSIPEKIWYARIIRHINGKLTHHKDESSKTTRLIRRELLLQFFPETEISKKEREIEKKGNKPILPLWKKLDDLLKIQKKNLAQNLA